MEILSILSLSLLFTTIFAQNSLTDQDDQEFLLDLHVEKEVESYMKMYIFNFTNPGEYFSDPNARAKLQQVGPYVYSKTWVKDEVRWLDSGRVEFVPKFVYRFQPKLSVGRQTDRITTINIPFVTALKKMKQGPQVARQAIGFLMDVLNQRPFETMIVREFLWGKSNPLLKLGRDTEPDPKKRYPFKVSGMFVGKNFTDNGFVVTSTGIGGSGYLGEILQWNGGQGLNFWQPGTECDAAKDSIGIFHKPNINRADTVHIFNGNLCRSIEMEFQREVTTRDGINTLRFVPSPRYYGTSRQFPENECFCVEESCKDLPRGLFNMTACQYGTPIIFSLPHFTRVEPSLLRDFDGLQPDEEQYQSYVDINPQLGLSMNFKVAGQINIAMNKENDVGPVKGLRKTIFPLMYFVDELSQNFYSDSEINRIKAIIANRS